MKRTTVIAGVLLVIAAAAGLSASGRRDLVGHFSARSVEMISPTRPLFARVDIQIARWSSDLEHRHLSRAILEQGPAGFAAALAGYPSVGSISVDEREFTVRYAWQSNDRDGGRRIYLGSDEPMQLMSRDFLRFADREPLLFLELRVNARGDGMGKLSDPARLSVDESRNVIELRDYDRRPVHLVMVHDELDFVD